MPRPWSSLVSLLALASLAATLSCSGSSQSGGALVVRITTDMQAPKDFDVLSVFVAEEGTVKLDYLGRVLPDGTVALPATVALVAPSGPNPPANLATVQLAGANASVHVRVTAFLGQAARVVRDVVTTVPGDRTALLNVPIDLLDDGSAMGTLPANLVPSPPAADGATTFDPTTVTSACAVAMGLTSLDGLCASANIDSSALPPYGAGDSGALACFDTATCLAGSTPVAGLDSSTCSFPLPAGADASHMNLALVTPSIGACLTAGQCFVPLPEDPSGGWSLVQGMVQLAPGVCRQLLGGATLRMSTGACAADGPAQSVCQAT
jgi:hypothetical protein